MLFFRVLPGASLAVKSGVLPFRALPRNKPMLPLTRALRVLHCALLLYLPRMLPFRPLPPVCSTTSIDELFGRTTWTSLAPTTCANFNGLPKYNVKLRKPSAFDLEWVYSVPCGEDGCDSWVFIDTSTAPSWGPDSKAWIEKYISEIGWSQVAKQSNKRFVCPLCSPCPKVCI